MEIIIIRRSFKEKADRIQKTKVHISDLYLIKYNLEVKLEECSNKQRRKYLLSELKTCLRSIEYIENSRAV